LIHYHYGWASHRLITIMLSIAHKALLAAWWQAIAIIFIDLSLCHYFAAYWWWWRIIFIITPLSQLGFSYIIWCHAFCYIDSWPLQWVTGQLFLIIIFIIGHWYWPLPDTAIGCHCLWCGHKLKDRLLIHRWLVYFGWCWLHSHCHHYYITFFTRYFHLIIYIMLIADRLAADAITPQLIQLSYAMLIAVIDIDTSLYYIIVIAATHIALLLLLNSYINIAATMIFAIISWPCCQPGYDWLILAYFHLPLLLLPFFIIGCLFHWFIIAITIITLSYCIIHYAITIDYWLKAVITLMILPLLHWLLGHFLFFFFITHMTILI